MSLALAKLDYANSLVQKCGWARLGSWHPSDIFPRKRLIPVEERCILHDSSASDHGVQAMASSFTKLL